jgi:branched-chain amino acid:cation transporter, LIVCS family
MSTKEYSLPLRKERSGLFKAGLALFSMFFGAGNLIFPLLIGKQAGDQTWMAILGLSFTAVVVPFLGLGAMVLFQADCKKFFSRLGSMPGFILLLLLQLILGPLGVIPRLVTLMHAMAKPYLFGIPITWFSVIAVAAIFLCSIRKQNLIGLLGAVLTPILLLSLGALLFLGFWNAGSVPVSSVSSMESFQMGLFGGYNTMDLIAAFLFATVILPHFQKEERGESAVKRKILFSSLIAAALLLVTYIGLAWISSYHAAGIDKQPEELLGAIAFKILGPAGGLIAAVAVIMACFTTAITLSTIFADYLQKDLCKGKIKPSAALICTLIITMLFANLGFSGIAAFLGPILQVVYPGLILLSGLNLLHSLYGFKMVKTPVFMVFGLAMLYFFSVG